MEELNYRYHHVGIHVENLESMVEFYRSIFNMEISLSRVSKFVTNHKDVQIIFLSNNKFIIELIGPIKNSGDLDKIHMGVSVNDISVFVINLERHKIDFEKFIKRDGAIDFIRFLDPEFNVFEIFQHDSYK